MLNDHFGPIWPSTIAKSQNGGLVIIGAERLRSHGQDNSTYGGTAVMLVGVTTQADIWWSIETAFDGLRASSPSADARVKVWTLL